MRLDTDLLALRTLLAVADTGSFSAAARRIGRTQSAVSLIVAKLEERVGVRLVDRTPRRAVPTARGEAFLSYARRIVALADEALLAVTAPEDGRPLRVGFADYLVPHHLADLLGRFRRAHPAAAIELRLGPGAALRQALDAGALDLAVTGGDGGAGGEVLLTEPMVWIGHHRRAAEPDPLPLVLMNVACSYRAAAIDALAGAGRRWRLAMEANAIHGVQSAVAADLGVSAVARSAVTEGLLDLGDALPALPATQIVATRAAGAAHPLAERLVDYLRETLPVLAPARAA